MGGGGVEGEGKDLDPPREEKRYPPGRLLHAQGAYPNKYMLRIRGGENSGGRGRKGNLWEKKSSWEGKNWAAQKKQLLCHLKGDQ